SQGGLQDIKLARSSQRVVIAAPRLSAYQRSFGGVSRRRGDFPPRSSASPWPTACFDLFVLPAGRPDVGARCGLCIRLCADRLGQLLAFIHPPTTASELRFHSVNSDRLEGCSQNGGYGMSTRQRMSLSPP